jgi:hypothetical protein
MLESLRHTVRRTKVFVYFLYPLRCSVAPRSTRNEGCLADTRAAKDVKRAVGNKGRARIKPCSIDSVVRSARKVRWGRNSNRECRRIGEPRIARSARIEDKKGAWRKRSAWQFAFRSTNPIGTDVRGRNVCVRLYIFAHRVALGSGNSVWGALRFCVEMEATVNLGNEGDSLDGFAV